MNSKIVSNGILRAVGILVGLAVLFYFLYEIRSVLAYLSMAAVVALIGRPVVLFLRRRIKFPNTMAVVVTMLLMVGILAGIIALFFPLINEQAANLSLLNIEDLRTKFITLYQKITLYFGASPEQFNDIIKGTAFERNIVQGFDIGFIPNFLNSFVNTLSAAGIGLFSVLFISFFFLKDSSLLQRGLLAFVPDDKEIGMSKSIEKINSLLSRYFVGLLFQILILFVIYTIVLLLAGIPNAVLIAFLCALFNVIPYVGPIIGAVFMIVLSMTSNLGADFTSVVLPNTGYVFIGFVFGQLIDNFFSQPIIFSNSVRSHPLEIFLVIIIAGILFGVLGLIVAVPGYTAIKVILKEFLSDNKIVKQITENL